MVQITEFEDIPEDIPTLMQQLELTRIDSEEKLPPWAQRPELVDFFHETMKPYEDSPEDILRSLDYAFSDSPGKGGFLILAGLQDRLAGALLMLRTGMGGYVPEYILLFVTVHPSLRGKGVGRKIIEKAVENLDGHVKLHVEYENPAKRLYERMGFESKYAEMRLIP